jgi:purine-binding chemotaxis protein CheW
MSDPAPAPLGAARHVVFRAGGERFALPLAAVREVVLPQPPFARVPRCGAPVRGAMNLRGRVIAVVDLAVLVGLPAAPPEESAGQIVVLEAARPGLGLLVAGVLGVESLATEAADGPPARGPALGRGVATRAGAATLLDALEVARAAESHFGAPLRENSGTATAVVP